MIFDQDWQGAETEFRRALELDPSDGEAYHFYAHYLDAFDRDDEALEAMSNAVRLDPFSAIHRCCLAVTHINRGELALAEEQVSRAMEIAPEIGFVHFNLGYVLELQGRIGDAVQSWEKAVELSDGKERFLLSALGYGYAVTGRREEALRIAAELEGWQERGIHTAGHRAQIFAGLGDLDRAFELLEQAREDRELLILTLTLNPGIAPLRQDPRFDALMRRIGIRP